MRILIAEDELLERKAMKKFLQKNFKDLEVVGEAENGRKAIELAKEKRPHIIFMDIKMPGINGLEAIEQIHASQPTIKFILVSAYDTFDYAKQAMQFGIKDYILKPGKKEEIVKALFRLSKEIHEEQKLLVEKRQSRQLLEDRLIGDLIEGHIHVELRELQESLYPHFKSGYFIVFEGEKNDEIHKIKEELEKSDVRAFLLKEQSGHIIALILDDHIEEKANQLRLARRLSLAFKNELYIGVGEIQTLFEKLPVSYREAYEACYRLRIDEKCTYGFLQENNVDRQNTKQIDQLLEKVEQGKTREALDIYQQSYPLLNRAEKEKLYIAIQNVLAKWNVASLEHSISSLNSVEDWHAYLTIACMKISEIHHSKQSMMKAKMYIEDHYAENLTLENVAASVQLSPNYFSNLFKEEFEETFIEFLTRTRMIQAKLLIEKNSYSLKEICFKIGYKDPNYFSRVFKRYYQLSPKHFQDRIFKK